MEGSKETTEVDVVIRRPGVQHITCSHSEEQSQQFGFN